MRFSKNFEDLQTENTSYKIHYCHNNLSLINFNNIIQH